MPAAISFQAVALSVEMVFGEGRLQTESDHTTPPIKLPTYYFRITFSPSINGWSLFVAAEGGGGAECECGWQRSHNHSSDDWTRLDGSSLSLVEIWMDLPIFRIHLIWLFASNHTPASLKWDGSSTNSHFLVYQNHHNHCYTFASIMTDYQAEI